MARTAQPSAFQRPFDEAFRWLLLTIVLWSFVALASTGQLPPFVAYGGVLLIITAWIGEKKFPLSRGQWLIVIVLFVIFDRWVFQNVGRIDAIVYMLIFLLANKMWSPKKSRDIMQILLLSFFFMVSAAVMTTHLSFLLSFIVFLFLIMVGMIFLTVRREHDALIRLGIGRQSGVNPKQVIPAEFYARTWGAVLITLFLTFWIFAMFPRLSVNQVLTQMATMQSSVSGFGREIQLGSQSDIRLNSSDVLRAQVWDTGREGEKPMEEIYLRGAAVESYSNGGWRASRQIRDWGDKKENTVRENRVIIETGYYYEPYVTRRTLRQRVFLDPRFGQDLFMLEGANRLSLNMLSGISLSINPLSNTCQMLSTRAEILTYEVTSHVRMTNSGDPDLIKPPRDSKIKPQPLQFEEVYLELPETPRMDQVRELADGIVEEAGAESPYEKVKAIESYFHRNFTYSLQDLDYGDEYPTETFLLDQQRGHCEYFASAMAMMLRRIGIPCRIINGYYTNYWNEVGRFFRVRESDAHSWIEAHFTSGWVAFDPTPPDSSVRSPHPPTLWTKASKWVDAIRMKWYLHVVDYDLSDQRRFISALLDKTPDFGRSFLKWGFDLNGLFDGESVRYRGGRAGKAIAAGLIFAVVIFGALSAGAMAQGRWRKYFVSSQAMHRRRIRVYERILAALARAGLPKPPGQTPLEHAGRVERVRPDLAGFLQLTERYYLARYGEIELSEQDEESFETFLRQTRSGPREAS